MTGSGDGGSTHIEVFVPHSPGSLASGERRPEGDGERGEAPGLRCCAAAAVPLLSSPHPLARARNDALLLWQAKSGREQSRAVREGPEEGSLRLGAPGPKCRLVAWALLRQLQSSIVAKRSRPAPRAAKRPATASCAVQRLRRRARSFPCGSGTKPYLMPNTFLPLRTRSTGAGQRSS